MKNPNGFGSVIKLSGNRRNPFMARKTVGWNEKGHPIYKAVGYAPTREEALIMLASFNKNPYDIDARKITVKEVFERYIETIKLSKSSLILLALPYIMLCNHNVNNHKKPCKIKAFLFLCY